jgi:hypothetical protein
MMHLLFLWSSLILLIKDSVGQGTPSAPTEYFVRNSCDGLRTEGLLLNTCLFYYDTYRRLTYSTVSGGFAANVDKLIFVEAVYSNLQDCNNKRYPTRTIPQEYASQCGYGIYSDYVFVGVKTGIPTTAGSNGGKLKL